MTKNVRLDSSSEEIVGSTEHLSASSANTESNEHTQSNENKTHSSGDATDSMIIEKDLLPSQRKTDAMTTYSPKSSTRKRSLISSTDSSDFGEETTTVRSLGQPQTSSSSEESHSSEEISGTERMEYIPDAGMSIPHRSYDLEREETTTLSRKESEFLAMAGAENRVKSILISPLVAVVSQQHDVLNAAGTEIPVEENNVGADENVGVTFDPDGMRHDGPQDPDSVVFSIPEDSRERDEDSAEREFSKEDKSFEVANKEREEVSIGKGRKPNEGKVVPNGIRKFEKLEHFYTESNTSEHENVHVEVPSKDYPNPIFFENGATLPEFQIHNYTGIVNRESEEMLQDAPHGVNLLPDFARDESVVVTEKQDPGQNSNGYSIAKTMTTEESKDIASTATVADNASVSHLPDQSAFRPVSVSSPSEIIASTSILPGSTSTQSGESSTTVSNPSVPIAGQVDKVVESSSPGTSGPILPDPVFKISGNVEVSTMIPQPELVDSTNATLNSTISRIEVKSSVSVSLPSSDLNNDSQSSLPTSTNSSLTLSSVDSPIAEKESNGKYVNPKWFRYIFATWVS